SSDLSGAIGAHSRTIIAARPRLHAGGCVIRNRCEIAICSALAVAGHEHMRAIGTNYERFWKAETVSGAGVSRRPKLRSVSGVVGDGGVRARAAAGDEHAGPIAAHGKPGRPVVLATAGQREADIN